MSPEFRIVKGMALLRLLSSAIELTAALLMLRLGKVDAALRINATLGLVGPLVMIGVTALGIAGLAQYVSYGKLLLVALGVGIVLFALKS